MDVLKKGKKIKDFRQGESKCGNYHMANILTKIAKSHTGLRHPAGGDLQIVSIVHVHRRRPIRFSHTYQSGSAPSDLGSVRVADGGSYLRRKEEGDYDSGRG